MTARRPDGHEISELVDAETEARRHHRRSLTADDDGRACGDGARRQFLPAVELARQHAAIETDAGDVQGNCVPGLVDPGSRQMRFSRYTDGPHSNVDDLGDAPWIGVAVQPRMLTIELFTKAWREW